MPGAAPSHFLRAFAGSDIHPPQAPGTGGIACPTVARLRRYGVALVATAVALLFHFLLGSSMRERTTLLTFALPTLVSAWYGGLGPGFLATGLGGLAVFYAFFPPRPAAALALIDNAVILVLFGCVGACISLLLASLHRTCQRAQAEALACRHTAAKLERRLQEHTAALHHELVERQRFAQETQSAAHLALLGRLAAEVSHEIRNPLGAILLHADLLEEELRQPSADSTTQIIQTLSEMKTQLARLENLMQDYLSLARISMLQREPTDVSAEVMAIAQEMAATLAEHRIALHIEGLAQLGTMALQPEAFRRVLLPLVQNAIDTCPQGGTLTLRARRSATQIQLEVCDTGSGIAAEHLPRIFEPLYTTKPGGTGLGLYIVQAIVAAHGGQVAVQSTVGQGTTFTITLPIAGEEGPAS
jgi:signal transduction histidine kinase